MAVVQDFVDEILIETPTALETTIARAVRSSIVEFCKQSECWLHKETIPLVKGTNQYALTLPSDTYILAADYCYYLNPNSSERRQLQSTLPERVNNELTGPTFEFYTDDTNVYINPAQEDGSIDIGVILAPRRQINTIDDSIADKYFEYIRAGALYRLLAQPKQPWSDPNMAMFYKGVYLDGITLAKREARKDRSRPTRVVNFCPDFSW